MKIHDVLNWAFTEEEDFQKLCTSEDKVQCVFQHVNITVRVHASGCLFEDNKFQGEGLGMCAPNNFI